MDARDLVLQEKIREYWKCKRFMVDFDSQLKLVMRAYTSVDEKKKYISDMLDDIQYTDNEKAELQKAMDILNLESRKKYDHDRYIKFYDCCDAIEKYIENDTELCESLDSFSGQCPNEFFSNDKLEEYINLDFDKLIFEYIIDIMTGKFVAIYTYFYIGNILSLCIDEFEESSEKDFIEKYIFYNDWFSNEVPLYPFEDNTYVSVRVEDIEVCGYYCNYIEDYSGHQYIYIMDRKSEGYDDISKGAADISYFYFKRFYNYYDWMKEKEE